MTSNINPAVPVQGNPTTASVRQNFQYAHDEIETLQNDVAGKAALVHTHDASAIISGTIDVARLSAMVGATSGTAGVEGIVPKPVAGEEDYYLKGDGTWVPAPGTGTVTSVDITQPAAGLTFSGGPVTGSGAITAALANDLAAVEGLNSTGVAVRTETDTWTVRTLTAGNGIAITNGDGVSGAPTIATDLDTDPGLEYNTGKLRTKVANGVKRTSSGIEMDIAGLTLENTLDPTNDLLAFYDASASANRQTAMAEILGRAPAVVASARGLKAYNNSGTPNSKIDVVINEIVVKNSSGKAVLLSSVSVTIDITASGANGLDGGSESSGTFYAVHIIWNGTTKSGLLSTSATSPTLPSGYTFSAFIGWVRNDGSSNFVKFMQVDRTIYIAPQVVFTAQAGTATYASQSISGMVPTNAVVAIGTCGISTTTSGDQAIAVAADTNGVGVHYAASFDAAGNVDSFFVAGNFRVPLLTAQTLYWISSNTSSIYRMVITGYII